MKKKKLQNWEKLLLFMYRPKQRTEIVLVFATLCDLTVAEAEAAFAEAHLRGMIHLP